MKSASSPFTGRSQSTSSRLLPLADEKLTFVATWSKTSPVELIFSPSGAILLNGITRYLLQGLKYWWGRNKDK